jgi:ribosomal protein S18 acetylase RimI-like enzyme
MVPASRVHALELRDWFTDESEAREWGGPALRYPFSEQNFLQDIHFGKIPAWVSEQADGQLRAFGQFYRRDGKCHLARLVVNPELRGVGLGRRFILELMSRGESALGTSGYSLFVMECNSAAVACYANLGFQRRDWPEDVPEIEGCIYMERLR